MLTLADTSSVETEPISSMCIILVKCEMISEYFLSQEPVLVSIASLSSKCLLQ